MNTEEVKNTIQAVIEGFTPLAEKLQLPVEKLFEWAIKENYVYVFTGIWGVLVYAILIWGFYKLVKYGFSKEEGRSRFYYSDGLVFWVVSLGLILVVTFPFIVFDIVPDIIARLVNPEYHAFIDLINLIKPQ